MNETRATRRTFLSDVGMGFTGLALGSLLSDDGYAADATTGLIPKAKSVIWLFLAGGVSHMESFDVKPALDQYAGMTFEETPFEDFLEKERIEKNLAGAGMTIPARKELMALNTGYQRYGECGLRVGNWFSHIGECADDLAVVRSLWTVHPNHGMQLTWHTGMHVREGAQPTIGAWASYGLGSMNEQLPKFVVMGKSIGGCCGGEFGHGASYLGPQHAGVKLSTDPKAPLPFVSPYGSGVTAEEADAQLQLIGQLNHAAGVQYPDDPDLLARIRSYELAAGMQTAVPELMQLDQETAETQSLYGLDEEHSREFGTQCLVARRLVEQGVRFVQLYHGTGSAGTWDSHSDIKQVRHRGPQSRQADRWPVERPETPRPAGFHNRGLRNRVWSHARRPARRWINSARPGSSSAGLLLLAGWWRNPGWRHARSNRRDRFLRR